MNILTLDFETYYSADYTLKKLTTEAYIRDPRFKAHGAGIRWPDGRLEWIPHDRLPSVLASIDWTTTAALAHHAQFDGLILSHHYGHHPARWIDTLSMARMLGLPGSLAALAQHFRLTPKGDALVQTLGLRELSPEVEHALADYCLHDVELTYIVFRHLAGFFPPSEYAAVDLTVKMFTRPLLQVDTEALQSVIAEEERQAAFLTETAGLTREILASVPRFRAWLQQQGVEPPESLAKTDPGMQALLEHDDPLVVAAVAARLGVSSRIVETRARRLLDAASRGALPVYLKYWGARTGRWSGGDKLNFQNLRKNSPLRTALLAPDGHMLVVADSSQIEARVLAWLAEDDDLLQAFAQGRDVYKEFASVVYGKPPEEISSTERFVAKTCILGLGYGTGAAKLRATLAQGTTGPKVEISEDEAQRLVTLYREQHPRIVALWKHCDAAIRAMCEGRSYSLPHISARSDQRIDTLPGVSLRYDDLRLTDLGEFEYKIDRKWVKIYGAKLVENLTQHYARMVITEQMVTIGKRYPVVMMTHDEIVCVARESEAQECLDYMLSVMRTAPDWADGLPLNAEGGFARGYSK